MIRLAAFITCSIFFSFPIHAEEAHSSVSLEAGYYGSDPIEVTETISIVSEGKLFKTGIARAYSLYNLPNNPWWWLGSAPAIPESPQYRMNVISVTRDDIPTPWKTASYKSILKLIMQTENKLSPGVHTYAVKYDVYDSVRQSDEGQEFELSTGKWTPPAQRSKITLKLSSTFRPEDISVSARIFSYSSGKARESPAITISPGTDTSSRTYAIELNSPMDRSESLVAYVRLRQEN